MTEAEKRYPQIDKEALAITLASERFSDSLIGFSDSLIGMNFKIETDHKPLIPLLGSNDLDILCPRVHRFRIRLMSFSYSIVYVPGKALSTADALSRAPIERQETRETKDRVGFSSSGLCRPSDQGFTSFKRAN